MDQLGFFFAPEKKLTKQEQRQQKKERDEAQKKHFEEMLDKLYEKDMYTKTKDGDIISFLCVSYEEIDRDKYETKAGLFTKHKYSLIDDDGNKYIWTTQQDLSYNELPFVIKCSVAKHLDKGKYLLITKGSLK